MIVNYEIHVRTTIKYGEQYGERIGWIWCEVCKDDLTGEEIFYTPTLDIRSVNLIPVSEKHSTVSILVSKIYQYLKAKFLNM